MPIRFNLVEVMAAIELDGQARAGIVEIHDEPRIHVLATEVNAGDLVPSQALP
jgi:hypothetical protein